MRERHGGKVMIPIEVENRIAKYFFHRYLPEGVMKEIVDRLLPPVYGLRRKIYTLKNLSAGQLRLLTTD